METTSAAGHRRWLLLLALCAAPGAGTPAFADEVDDAMAVLRKLEKSGDDVQCITAMQTVSAWSDPRVSAEFRELAASGSDAVACAAIRALADHKDPKGLEWVRGKIGDKGLWKDKGARPEVYACVLDGARIYADASLMGPLEDAVKTFMTSNADFATRSIHAYGAIRQKPVVGQLIAWLGQLEPHHGGKSSGGSGGSAKYAPETQAIRDSAIRVLSQTLSDATDQDLGDVANWEKWWAVHAKTFEFPKPDPIEHADVTTLTEWTDTRYGYTVKRPEPKGWAFKPRDAQFRVQLLQIVNGRWLAHVGWNVRRTAGGDIKDMQGFTDWWIKKQLPDFEFKQYGPGGEPAAAQKSFSGREWTVVTAIGTGKDGMAQWGSFEQRVYMTKVDAGFLYAWAVVRTDLLPEEKQRAFDVVEQVVFAGE